MGRFAALGLIVSLACAGGEEEAPEPADRTMVAESATVSGPRPPAGHAWVIFGATLPNAIDHSPRAPGLPTAASPSAGRPGATGTTVTAAATGRTRTGTGGSR